VTAVPSAIERVGEALRARGVPSEIREFPQSTRTAADAAAAIGTTVGQIVKSLVFLSDGRPVLVLASGANRVDLIKLATASGAHAVQRASAAEVRRVTGFSIGGVPPVGHATPLAAYIDRDLLRYDVVYASAGTPTAVFAIDPRSLQALTDAVAADLASSSQGAADS
jgi:Cys-tRNA(Pro) deacylase